MGAPRSRIVQLVVICAVMAAARIASARSTGITSNAWNYTNAAGCASCHVPTVGVEPAIVSFANSTATLTTPTGMIEAMVGVADKYTITIALGDRSAAGINVSSNAGALALCASVAAGDACDLQATTTELPAGGPLVAPYSPQITHKMKRPKGGNGQVQFAFNFTPPADACSSVVTIWILGADNTGTAQADQAKAFTYTIASNNGGTCNGGACSGPGTCGNGECIGTPIDCAPLDECHEAGVCDVAMGGCSNPTKPDGTACSTGTCSAGVCGGNPGGEHDPTMVPDGGGGCCQGNRGASSAGAALFVLLARSRRRRRSR